MASEIYAISVNPNDIDFYIGGINATAYIDSTSAVSVSAYKINLASSSVNLTSDVLIGPHALIKIALGSSASALTTAIVTVAAEILHVLLYSDTHLTTNIEAQKIAYAAGLINPNASLSSNVLKTTKATVQINSLTSTVFSAIKVIKAIPLPISTGVSYLDFSTKEIQFASLSLILQSAVLANPPIRFSPNFIDSESIRTLLILDNKPLTDHAREFDSGINPIFIENKNWQNNKSRYYKKSTSSGRKTFNITWKFLPNFREKTVDQRYARDYISSIAEDPDVHVLKIINQNASGTTVYTETSYNVYVSSYSETLVRRDIADGVYYFDCNLALEEA